MIIDTSIIKAVIFDMDGTIIDNMQYHKAAFEEFFKKRNILLTDDDFKNVIIGSYNAKIFSTLFKKELSGEEIINFTDEKEEIYRKIYKPFIKELNGFKSLISKLKSKNVKLGIATTSPLGNREFTLNELNLDGVFNIIVGVEDVKIGKPDPEIYIKASEKLNVAPVNCMAFEDSLAGIQSASSAGIKTIGITTTHSAKELESADFLISDFTEVEVK